jgi:hypothetical protein
MYCLLVPAGAVLEGQRHTYNVFLKGYIASQLNEGENSTLAEIFIVFIDQSSYVRHEKCCPKSQSAGIFRESSKLVVY